jgi:hypothetical protein
MATRQVPVEEWDTFFDDFSKTYEGRKAEAQLHGRGAVDDEEVNRLPFMGVTLEKKGSDAHSVRIMLGDAPGAHLTHEVLAPKAVWVRSDRDEDGAMLEIQGGDDQTTVIRFWQGDKAPVSSYD